MPTRDYIMFYLNGTRTTVQNTDIFMPLANFLRYAQGKTGTKIVCAEGDCGACTVLLGKPRENATANDAMEYNICNACILPVYSVDGCHVVTIEGIATDTKNLDPVQRAFIESNASQCGFCTPGFVMSMVGLYEENSCPTSKDVQNATTGNLCRCTGYDAILSAGTSVQTDGRSTIQTRYHSPEMHKDILEHNKLSVEIIQDNHAYYAPHSIHDALEKQNIAGIRITAGSTDIGVQINKGYTRTNKVLDLRLISDLYELSENEEEITVGARVTWKRLRSFCLASLPDFATFLNLFASPQIRNVGTLVGNIANASPIGDSLPYLLMANARVRVFGNDGYREIPMTELYTGYKKLALHPGEFITHVIIPKPHAQEKIKLYKISARRDLDISCVNMACSIRLEQDRIVDFRLVYGGVGPVVLRMYAVEQYLKQSNLSQLDIQKLVEMVKENIAPISDVRGSDKFRIRSAQNLLRKFFIEITKIVEVEKSL